MSEHAVISLPLQRTAEVPLCNLQAASGRSRSPSPLPADRLLHFVRDGRVGYRVFDNASLDRRRFLFSGLCDLDSRRISLPPLCLHGRFPPGKGVIRRFLHERLDPLHWEHHMRPFDGKHISRELKDNSAVVFCPLRRSAFCFRSTPRPSCSPASSRATSTKNGCTTRCTFRIPGSPSFGG